MQFLVLVTIFVIFHVTCWYSLNLQLIMNDQRSALMWAILLGIPVSLLGFYVTKLGHAYYSSLWSVRLIGFGTSYLVFPAMTYFYLSESPMNPKTLACIALSFAIICIQVFWKNT
jgi:hypothetical protein